MHLFAVRVRVHVRVLLFPEIGFHPEFSRKLTDSSYTYCLKLSAN
jgi:hypothetical protein